MSWWQDLKENISNIKNNITNWIADKTGYKESSNEAVNEWIEDQDRIKYEQQTHDPDYNYIDLLKDKNQEKKNDFVYDFKKWWERLFYGEELSVADEMEITDNIMKNFEEKQEEDGLEMTDEEFNNMSWWDKIKAGFKTFGNLWGTSKELLKENMSTLGNNIMQEATGGEAAPPSYAEDVLTETPQQEIKDKTNTNIENSLSALNYEQIKADMIAERDARWAREDAIRKETQAREDTAYQRAVDDMIKAGINPNLVGVNPASSGGGITSVEGMNYTPMQIEAQKEMSALSRDLEEFLTIFEKETDIEFKGNENEKDRFLDAAGKVLSAFMMYKLGKGLKK